ncbi:triacylglycerol lipase, partial [Streptococcus sp. H49]
DGEPDTSQIVIAYAGTNRLDSKDLSTDIQSLGLGSNKLGNGSDLSAENLVFSDSQFVTALDFADQIAKAYPEAHITSTGHSLGEAIAMYVALKNGWSNVGYNGPDIANLISDKELLYMQTHPEEFRNFRNSSDIIGGITGNKTKTAIYAAGKKGYMGVQDILSNHSLTVWQFTEDGRLIYADGRISTGTAMSEFAEIKTSVTLQMATLRGLKDSFSSGGYTSSERIFLDSSQAQLIGSQIAAAAQTCAESIKKTCQEAISQAEQLWQDAVQQALAASSTLTEAEVKEALSLGGVTEETIVGATKTVFEAIETEAGTLAESFAQINSEINKGIASKLASDSELAGRFSQWQTQLSQSS